MPSFLTRRPWSICWTLRAGGRRPTWSATPRRLLTGRLRRWLLAPWRRRLRSHRRQLRANWRLKLRARRRRQLRPRRQRQLQAFWQRCNRRSVLAVGGYGRRPPWRGLRSSGAFCGRFWWRTRLPGRPPLRSRAAEWRCCALLTLLPTLIRTLRRCCHRRVHIRTCTPAWYIAWAATGGRYLIWRCLLWRPFTRTLVVDVWSLGQRTPRSWPGGA